MFRSRSPHENTVMRDNLCDRLHNRPTIMGNTIYTHPGPLWTHTHTDETCPLCFSSTAMLCWTVIELKLPPPPPPPVLSQQPPCSAGPGGPAHCGGIRAVGQVKPWGAPQNSGGGGGGLWVQIPPLALPHRGAQGLHLIGRFITDVRLCVRK